MLLNIVFFIGGAVAMFLLRPIIIDDYNKGRKDVEKAITEANTLTQDVKAEVLAEIKKI